MRQATHTGRRSKHAWLGLSVPRPTLWPWFGATWYTEYVHACQGFPRFLIVLEKDRDEIESVTETWHNAQEVQKNVRAVQELAGIWDRCLRLCSEDVLPALHLA